MVTHACGTRTHRPTLFVPIHIDKNNRCIESFVDKELTKSNYLFLSQCLFGMSIGSDRTIDVVPKIGSTLTCHSLNMLTAHQFVVVVLADAGCHTKDESCLSTSTNTSESTLIDFIGLATAVTLLFQTLDADERRDIASLAELESYLFGQKCTIGEELEIAVVMPLEGVEKPFVHQRFTTQDAEELGAMPLALSDDAIYLLHGQMLPSSLTHPTSAASEVAGLGDGNHVEGGEEGFASLLPLLEVAHVGQIGQAEVPAELPQQPDGGLSEHPPADFHQ